MSLDVFIYKDKGQFTSNQTLTRSQSKSSTFTYSPVSYNTILKNIKERGKNMITSSLTDFQQQHLKFCK